MIRFFSKYFLVALAICISANFIQAQELTFDHGKVDFYTSSILSDIEATSEEIDVQLDLTSGDVKIVIGIKTFEFEYEMMQDHFNEEYMESEKYPNATFIGTIDQNLSDLVDKTEVNVTGEMTIHGVSKQISFKSTLFKKDGYTVVKCKFPIVFKDYNVEEPSVLTKSVATDVELKSTLYLK